jgi:hypothetical protein
MPTIRPNDINFGPSSLSAGLLTVTYDAITSVRFEYIAYKHYPQMVTLHHPHLEFFIDNSPASVKVGRKILASFGMSQESARKVVVIYQELARRTFSERLARYADQIEHAGGFAYDGKRFMKDGNVLSSRGTPIVNLRDQRLVRFPDRIECRASEGVMSYVARFVPMPGQTVYTRFDRDVFYTLLDTLYGIRWE